MWFLAVWEPRRLRPCVEWVTRITKRRRGGFPYRSPRRELKLGVIIRNGHSKRRFLGGKSLESCG